nr:hypothetical protein [uncultured Mucilaginibacter sp.]
MDLSIWISIGALSVSLFALYQSYLSQKHTVISNIENQLTLKAQDCNRLIHPITKAHPTNTQDVSEAVTAILYAKGHLSLAYKNHALLLFTCDQNDFIEFFLLQLHSSIKELIKNPLPSTVNDLALRRKIQSQHNECKKFLNL